MSRLTYCAVLNPKPQILCFFEKIRRDVGLGGKVNTSTIHLPEVDRPIVHIEAIPTRHDNNESVSVDVLCVRQDGFTQCYNMALQAQQWTSPIPLASNGDQSLHPIQVLHVSSVSLQQAIENLLVSRQDLTSFLEAKRDYYASSVLLFVTRSLPESSAGDGGSLVYRIMGIKDIGHLENEVSSFGQNQLEELASLVVPEPQGMRGKAASFKLHHSSGTLYQATNEKLVTYDLRTLSPSLLGMVDFPRAKYILSFVRISSDIVATTSADSVTLTNTKFSSFQAMYNVTGIETPWPGTPNRKKRKRVPLGEASPQLVSYHGPSSSLIVLSGQTLMAVDISTSKRRSLTSRKRKEEGLLIDAVGRGSLLPTEQKLSRKRLKDLPRALGRLVDTFEEPPGWAERRKSLDALWQHGDLVEFDRTLLSEKHDETNMINFKSAAAYLSETEVDYCLSKIFLTSPTEFWNDGYTCNDLRVQALPEETWRNILQKGLLSLERLQAALRRREIMTGNSVLKNTALIQALADWDPTLGELLPLLESPCMIKIAEVCYALNITVTKFAASRDTKLLTGGEEALPLDLRPDGSSELGKIAAGTSRNSYDHTDHLHALLDTIIVRCDACPSSLVAAALRTHLSRSDLRNIIDLLRMKLAQNGWLSPYTEDICPSPNQAQQQSYDNDQISRITKLLNCAIDSLGTGGWLLDQTATGDESTTKAMETVSYMKAEVAAALEGIEEATYLQGMLGEILLCGKAALNSGDYQNVRSSRVPCTAAQIDWGNNEDPGKKLLPLGLRLEQNIPLTKVGAGGELQRRTRRDIGHLKSKRVPKYSFERIVV